MRRRHYGVLQDEIDKWPGASLRPLRENRHLVLEVAFKDRRGRITFQKSPSDHRSSKNSITQLRRVLRDLGAQKEH